MKTKKSKLIKVVKFLSFNLFQFITLSNFVNFFFKKFLAKFIKKSCQLIFKKKMSESIDFQGDKERGEIREGKKENKNKNIDFILPFFLTILIILIFSLIFAATNYWKKKIKTAKTADNRIRIDVIDRSKIPSSVRVGRLYNFPPFWYQGNGNSLGYKGIDHDIIQNVLNNIPEIKRVEYIEYMTFEEVYAALLRGDIDIIANDLWITPGRQSQISFTIPYYFQDGIAMTFLKGNSNIYKTSKDLEGKKVGVIRGNEEHYWLPDIDFKEIVIFDDVNDLMKAIVNKDIDVSIEWHSAFFVIDPKLQRQTDTIIIKHYPTAMATRKEDGNLLFALNKVLKEVWNDATLYWIKSRYLPEYLLEPYNYSPYD